MSDPSDALPQPPQVPAVLIDPTHPEAGDGGVVPPFDTRFGGPRANPGNPGGRPKGADIRAAIRRSLARQPDADGYGAEAVRLATKLLDLADAGDSEGVRAICQVIDQVQGKPTEHVVQEQHGERVVILRQPPPPQSLPGTGS